MLIHRLEQYSSPRHRLQVLSQQPVLVSKSVLISCMRNQSFFNCFFFFSEFDQFLAQRAAKGDSLPPARPRPQMQKAEDQSDELFAL